MILWHLYSSEVFLDSLEAAARLACEGCASFALGNAAFQTLNGACPAVLLVDQAARSEVSVWQMR